MFESAELDHKLSKKDFEAKEPQVREGLLDAQAALAESDLRLIIVIAGAEGAGKGETIHTLLEWMDSRGVETHALGAPTQQDEERPRYYRFWRRLPAAGRIGIFFGSWYTLPIVAHSLGQCDDDKLARDLTQILDFERMLVEENTLLLKFWLHISKKQQKKVFEKLSQDPDTAWRVTPRDWEFHETYDEFVRTSSRALSRTDDPHAPWDIVSARDHRYRDIAVAERVLTALEKRLEAPPVTEPPSPVPPAPPKLERLRAVDLTQTVEREEYDDKLTKHQGRLGRLARRMNDQGCSAVLVFEGMDAAGKGGCIRRVTSALDARFYRVIPIGAPTDEERAHPYLWRFWRHVPGWGHFTLFDRSWYGRVLVERVEGFSPPAVWQRAYTEINAFEAQLIEAGTQVHKFWLMTSPEEQLRRFEEREATGHKRYKITDEDWRNREKWPQYEEAAADMIEKTGTARAPWHLVAAEDKRRARVEVLKVLCDGLEQSVGPDEKKDKKKDKKRGKKG